MALEYKPLAQVRENSTNPVLLYQPAAGETVEVSLRIANNSASAVLVRIFHDIDGTTYDEASALVWDFEIESGLFLPVTGIKMDSSGSLAYRSAIANALTATVYGIVKT